VQSLILICTEFNLCAADAAVLLLLLLLLLLGAGSAWPVAGRLAE